MNQIRGQRCQFNSNVEAAVSTRGSVIGIFDRSLPLFLAHLFAALSGVRSRDPIAIMQKS
jgi:hypothetical protein